MNSATSPYIHVNPYQQLLSELGFLLAGRASVLTLTGATGTGKTALLKQLTSQLKQNRHHVLMPDPVPQSIADLQHYLVRELDLPADDSVTDALLRHIAQLPGDRPHLTLIFDDADTLDRDTLQFIAAMRGTMARTRGTEPQLGIMLCGRAALETRLAEPSLKPLLDDRLAAHTIEAMTRKQLLAFCITWMAAQQAIFKLDPGMLNAIAATSGNLPGAVPAVLQKLGARLAGAEPAIFPAPVRASLPGPEDDEHPNSGAIAETTAEAARRTGPEAVDVVHDPEPVLAPDTSDIEIFSTPDRATASAMDNGAAFAAMPNDGRRAGTAPAAVAIAVPGFDADVHFATWADSNDLDRQRPPRFFRYTAFAASALIAAGLAWTVFSPSANAPAIDIVARDAGATAQPVADATVIAPPAAVIEEIAPEPAAPVIDTLVTSTNDDVQSTPLAAVAQTSVKTKPAPVPGDAVTLQNFVRNWLDAWQSQNLPAFFEHYHTDFAPQDQTTRAAWRNERQIRISSPANIRIEMEAFQVDRRSPLGIWVSFWMTYRSPTYADRTHKEVLIGPDLDGEWRILQELNRQVEVIGSSVAAPPVTTVEPMIPVDAAEPVEAVETAEPANAVAGPAPTAAGISPSDDALTRAYEVANFFATWLASWENQDMTAYFQHYVPGFTSDGLASPEAWRSERAAKIGRPEHIRLVLQNMDILESDADRALVELKLEYHTRDYADRTIKEIRLTKNGSGKWRITQETNHHVELLPLVF